MIANLQWGAFRVLIGAGFLEGNASIFFGLLVSVITV